MSENVTLENKQSAEHEERSRVESYQHLRRRVIRNKRALKAASNKEEIRNALDSLDSLMRWTQGVLELLDVNRILLDIEGMIPSVEKHGEDRDQLIHMLEMLQREIDEIIAEENKKDSVNLLREFFLECAEHAEELAKVIDLDTIFG